MSLLTDVLRIPELFGDLYTITARIGYALILPVLVIAILHENLSQIQGEANYSRLFVRLLCVLGLLILYEQFFMMVIEGMQLLGDAIMPKGEFERVILEVFHEIRSNKDLGFLNLIKANFINMMINLTYILALTAYHVLAWLRFVLLSCLYCIGPIAISFGIYRPTGQCLSAWIRSLIQISAWMVVLSFLMRVVTVMNLTAIYKVAETNSISIIAGNIFFVFLFIFTPIITKIITQGGSFGTAGTAFVGLVTGIAYTIARRGYYLRRNVHGIANAERSRQADEEAKA